MVIVILINNYKKHVYMSMYSMYHSVMLNLYQFRKMLVYADCYLISQ